MNFGVSYLGEKNSLQAGASIDHHMLFPGRYHYTDIWLGRCRCIDINVHFQPEVGELRRRLRSAAVVWPFYPDGVGFLLGDFHISFPDEGRFNTMVTPAELPLFTRKNEMRHGTISVLSRASTVFW